ncbi:hypothetical protein [Calothrix rhizosoleniae]|uniref:hypothetical protein n=1 Tax=Calothrix rhizosoleniae TaxID=888997 RepID=UPI000B499E47|nr:hypothetical protein [Calothrix rhizosoleniae]
MKTPLFIVCSIALLVGLSACVEEELVNTNQSSQNNQTSVVQSNNSSQTSQTSQNSQTSVVQSDDNSDMNSNFSVSSQQSTSSSSFQKSSVGLNAANLGKPHILSIQTSGNQLNGEIRIDGKVVKQIRNKKVDVNLSPYLSVGEHQVEISARYTPTDADVSIEFNAPGTSNNQQTSGDGELKYQMDVIVR